MNLDRLKARVAELVEEEKRAWAHLNWVCGARAECERLIAEAQQESGPPTQTEVIDQGA